MITCLKYSVDEVPSCFGHDLSHHMIPARSRKADLLVPKPLNHNVRWKGFDVTYGMGEVTESTCIETSLGIAYTGINSRISLFSR